MKNPFGLAESRSNASAAICESSFVSCCQPSMKPKTGSFSALRKLSRLSIRIYPFPMNSSTMLRPSLRLPFSASGSYALMPCPI